MEEWLSGRVSGMEPRGSEFEQNYDKKRDLKKSNLFTLMPFLMISIKL